MSKVINEPTLSYYSGQLSKKQQEYAETVNRDEIFEVKKKLLNEIRDLERKIALLKINGVTQSQNTDGKESL